MRTAFGTGWQESLHMGALAAAGLLPKGALASETHRKETSPSGSGVLKAGGSRSTRVSCFCALIWGAISREGVPLQGVPKMDFSKLRSEWSSCPHQ